MTGSCLAKLLLRLCLALLAAGPFTALAANGLRRADQLTISSVAPASKDVGTSFTITVKGTGFTDSTTVLYIPAGAGNANGFPLRTTYVSPTQVTAQYEGSIFNPAGQMTIYLQNIPGGARSEAAYILLNNPSPTLNNVTVINGSSLTLDGYGFVWKSVVKADGVELFSITGSGRKINAAFDPKMIKNPKAVSLTVTNPGPGGGTSKAVVVDLTK